MAAEERPSEVLTGQNLTARQAADRADQEFLMNNWVGETRDPKTGEITERRIIANGQAFMANTRGYGYI